MNHRFLLFSSLVASSTGILLVLPISAELSIINRPHISQILQQPNVSNLIAIDDKSLNILERQERPDWASFFDSVQAQGTIVVLDQRGGAQQLWVYNQERADRAYSPASTFKIPHSLFALDAGVVRDEFQVFEWDGVERDFAPHNQDQTLRSAIRNSAVWVYEIFAAEIGEAKAREYLTQIDYGNADPSTSEGAYWIDGALAISAQEQIYFLQKLYQNELPFRVEHQRLVKDIMIVEAEQDWILRAKTGWEGRWGWWVGWVEWPTGPVFFALNIDTPNRLDDLYKREDITRAILQSINALPAEEHRK
jgi:beta-lactamase class D